MRRPGATLRPVEAERIATTGALTIDDRSFPDQSPSADRSTRSVPGAAGQHPLVAADRPRARATRLVRRVPPALHQRLVERNRWPAFLADLDKLAGALETDLPPVHYRARRQLCAVPHRLFAAVRAGRLLAGDLPSDVVPDELLVRLFWQTYTGGDLLLAAPPVGWRRRPRPGGAGSKTCARRRRRCCSPLRRSWKPVDGSAPPARWSGGPACGDPAAPDDALTTVWSRSVEQDQDWPFGDHDIALSDRARLQPWL